MSAPIAGLDEVLSRVRVPARDPSEAKILNDILIALGARPDLRIERINVLRGRAPNGRWVRSASEGHADLDLVVRMSDGLARPLYLEVKSATGRLRPAQRTWGASRLRMGAVYLVVRSKEAAERAVAELQADPHALLARANLALQTRGGRRG